VARNNVLSRSGTVRAAWAAGERAGKHANYTRSRVYRAHTVCNIPAALSRVSSIRAPPHRKGLGHTKGPSARREGCNSRALARGPSRFYLSPRRSSAARIIFSAAVGRRVGGGAAVKTGCNLIRAPERIRHSAPAAAARWAARRMGFRG